MSPVEYSAHDIQAINLVQGVCKRPQMYTPTGSLGEVIAFLFGHMSASWQRQNIVDPSVKKTIQWLDEQYRPTSDLIGVLLSKHNSEKKALEAIEKFAAELPTH